MKIIRRRFRWKTSQIMEWLVKAPLNDTPIHYLLRYRLQEAAKLLVTTEKKIAVISECSGFDNV